MSRTVYDVIHSLPPVQQATKLLAPSYTLEVKGTHMEFNRGQGPKIMLAVESMRRHTTDEGFQLALGLQHAGWHLEGNKLGHNKCDVRWIMENLKPSVLLLQDKREWDRTSIGCKDRDAHFYNVDCLRRCHDVFKLTVLKDAHQRPEYHRNSADEIGCHAWVIYYHPDVVCKLAGYVRREHLIRTWHSVDPSCVPEFSLTYMPPVAVPSNYGLMHPIRRHSPSSQEERSGVLLSGAVSGVYPLRKRLIEGLQGLPETTYLKHPGYHANGCCTPEFLRTLSRFKVAICTSSIYGYTLRKIIEATACGCSVLTDLPVDEKMPEIDGNLVRINPDLSMEGIRKVLRQMLNEWDASKQQEHARKAIAWYNYQAVGKRLSDDINAMKESYPCC